MHQISNDNKMYLTSKYKKYKKILTYTLIKFGRLASDSGIVPLRLF